MIDTIITIWFGMPRISRMVILITALLLCGVILSSRPYYNIDGSTNQVHILGNMILLGLGLLTLFSISPDKDDTKDDDLYPYDEYPHPSKGYLTRLAQNLYDAPEPPPAEHPPSHSTLTR